MKPRILHLVALDTVGGVEQLYNFYIKASIDQFSHLTLNDRRHIFPAFLPTIERYSEAIESTKQWHNLPVPKVFRNAHLSRCLKKLNPDLVVVWNKVDGFDRSLLSGSTPVIYYEHGGGRTSPRPVLAKKFLEDVDRVVCASEASKELITRKWQLSRNDLLVCHNAIRPECFPEKSQVAAKKLNRDREIILGMAGRLISNKGFPVVLHSLQQLLNKGFKVRLRIAGHGPELDSFVRISHELNIHRQVDFLGNVDEISDFYRSLDIFLCPSLNESFGLVAAEAGAWGIPVICSDVGGLSEVVQHNLTGMLIKPDLTTSQYQSLGAHPDKDLESLLYDIHGIEPLVAISPEKMTTQVVELLNDPERYHSMSTNAIDRSRRVFSPNSYIKRLNTLFRESITAG